MRAESGTADTPAFPMSGLILLSFFKIKLNIFTKITPEAVAITNDKAPNPNIFSESTVRNSEACVEAPTVNPNKMVMDHARFLPNGGLRRFLLTNYRRIAYPAKEVLMALRNRLVVNLQ